MTPKEKAEELFEKFYGCDPLMDYTNTKQCALIAVDEILTLRAELFDKLPNPHNYFLINYWKIVKHEIEQL